MKSMTGFAEESYVGEDFQLSLSLRSVNGRYLEVRPHLPKEYFSLESEIKKRIQAQISRSTVDLFVSRKILPGKKSIRPVVNKDLAKSLFKVSEDLRKSLKVKEGLSIANLLRWTEVINFEFDESPVDGESKIFFGLLDKVLKKCNSERTREGEALANEIKKHLKELQNLADKMKVLAQPNQDLVRQNLQSRWLKLRGSEEVDENRLAQEIVIHIDRLDVTEEISRLQEHISACLDLLGSEKVLGKKLEFFCQELLREVNTLGSKSQKTELTHHVVEAKGCIERLREQVQNIE